MTQVKICGLTRPDDVRLACALGASYVGFVFAAASPRRVKLEQARSLAEAVSPGIARVGVFVDEEYAFIDRAVSEAQLDLAQIHRPLREEDLEQIRVPLVAVVSVSVDVGAGTPALALPGLLSRCRAVLFDTALGTSWRSASGSGGTGERFNWAILSPMRVPVPFWVAGGLSPDNAGEAIRRLQPSALDVSTGVEAEPGAKDPVKLARFFEVVKEADGSH